MLTQSRNIAKWKLLHLALRSCTPDIKRIVQKGAGKEPNLSGMLIGELMHIIWHQIGTPIWPTSRSSDLVVLQQVLKEAGVCTEVYFIPVPNHSFRPYDTVIASIL